jgi:hypothetical protein
MNFAPSDELATLYKIAAEHCKPLFPQRVEGLDTPATIVGDKANTGIETLIAIAEKELLAAIAERFEALRAAPRATNATAEAPSDGTITDLITPGHAVYLTGIPRPTLYRLCIRHPIGTTDGFSLKREGEHHFLISQTRLESFLRKRPRRVKRIETKKPGGETR